MPGSVGLPRPPGVVDTGDPGHPGDAALRERYLDLLKNSLTRYHCGERWQSYGPRPGSWRERVVDVAQGWLARRGLELVLVFDFDPERRRTGRDWPPEAETMIGTERLDQLQDCLHTVITEQVPGDLIETGVWRGGSCIFMRGVLAAYGVTDRTVWLADSFSGLPEPAPGRTDDLEDALWTRGAVLGVPQDEVEANVARYGLLDDQVRFLPGWFADTLPSAPIERLALLRLDGDMYDSTMVALESLYPRLSAGGFVIADDYGAVRGCRQAVDDFRARERITEPLERTGWSCAWWRRRP